MASVAPIDGFEMLLEPVELPLRKGTLLIVDDEDGPRQALRVVFKDDYDILMAADGPTAIQMAQGQRIDVALLDIRMAGMSGIEVLERLKFVEPSMEVVMMTAFETTDTMRQALRLRACDYINKPFDISTMRAAVANAMQRHTLEGEIHNNAEKLQLEPSATSEMFQMADRLDRFNKPLESGLKVANMGAKTLRWDAGGESWEAKFNYSTIEDAKLLSDRFEAIAECARTLLELRRAIRHDRLGVNAAVLKIQVLWNDKRLVATADFLPVLDRVAKDEVYIHMARERAAQIADAIRARSN